MTIRDCVRKILTVILALIVMLTGNGFPANAETADLLFGEPDVVQQPTIQYESMAQETIAVENEGQSPLEEETLSEKSGLEVFFFDLGRVDDILIRCDGKTCFIDSGFDRNAKQVISFMRGLGIEKLDAYVGTHAHADHIEGAARIIAEMKPDVFYIPHEKVYTAVMNASVNEAYKAAVAATECVVLTHGQFFQIGGASMVCFGPIEIVSCNYAETIENSNSLILKLIYGERSFLFTGDTADSVLREVSQKYPGALDSDILKNPHHNGKHAEDVIKMISPKITVFCTENASQPVNAYKTLLKQNGSDILITGSDNQGHILIKTDGSKVDTLFGYPLTDIQLNEVKQSLYPTAEVNLTASVEPSQYANPKWVNWKSSDTAVARISDGKLTAVGEGKATITATAINGVSDSIEVEVFITTVLLEKNELEMLVGDQKSVGVKVIPSDAKDITGEWYSEDDSIAWVTSDGKIIGVAPGTTWVYARLSNGAKAACEVTVNGIEVEKIKLNTNRLTVPLGEGGQMSVEFTPSNATDQQLEWKSSNESVLTVDQLGNVKAVGYGTASIGVKSGNGKYDICEITVK